MHVYVIKESGSYNLKSFKRRVKSAVYLYPIRFRSEFVFVLFYFVFYFFLFFPQFNGYYQIELYISCPRCFVSCELLTLCRVDPYVNVIMDDNPYLELACIITNSLK